MGYIRITMIATTSLQFSPSLLLRTPAYSYLEYNNSEIPLDDSYFRMAIAVSSAILFKEIEKKEFDWDKLTEKEKQTLFKYWNRVCFRPTPFALFAGISTAKWGKGESFILNSDERLIHARPSYNTQLEVISQIQESTPTVEQYFVSNNTIYSNNDEYRFVVTILDEKGTYNHEISSIVKDELLEAVLAFTLTPQTISAIFKHVAKYLPISKAECYAYIRELEEAQLLCNYLEPRITDQDYLLHYLNCHNCLPDETARLSRLKQLSQLPVNDSLEVLQQLRTSTNNSPLRKNDLNIITETVAKTGSLDTVYQQVILDGIYCINKLNPQLELPGLKNFKEHFTAKFDQQFVPLMQALDPEIGVDYLQMSEGKQLSPLLKDLLFSSEQMEHKKITWTPAHQLLLKKFCKITNERGKTIRLSDEDIEKLPVIEGGSLPNTISILIRPIGSKVWIEDGGGATATALTGRFTTVNSNLAEDVKCLAGFEAEANPGIAFAEIVHVSECHTADIIERTAIRQYEIPIVNQSGTDCEQQILLDELKVGIVQNEIILYCPRLQKRVVPRLSSAYNYTRSQLAVFRFLGDLQHQGLRSNISFKLSSFIPDQEYYPRVQFKNAILSLAEWIPTKEVRKYIKAADDEVDKAARLIGYYNNSRMPRFITAGEHDRQLVLDMDNMNDIKLLASMLTQEKSLSIKEFPFIENQTPIIQSGSGHPIHGQFVANLYHREKVYRDIPTDFFRNQDTERDFIPGSKWFYFKLYCHTARTNELLTDYVVPFIQSFNGHCDKYFYIRYNDPQHHLRIRLSFDHEYPADLLNRLYAWFSKPVRGNFISKINIDTYQRELERYDSSIIDEVESSFYASSELVLNFINQVTSDPSDYGYYQFAFCSVDQLASNFGLDNKLKEYHFQKLFEAFALEFKIAGNTLVDKQLKDKYRELNSAGVFAPGNWALLNTIPALSEHLQQFHNILSAISSKITHWTFNKKVQLFRDLIHMHLNRLLVEEPRQQEMVIYYCLSKYYYGLMGRERKNPVAKQPGL